MNPDLLAEAKRLWDDHQKIRKVDTQLGFIPPQEAVRLVNGFFKLADSLNFKLHPTTREEVFGNELKRRFQSEAERVDGFSSSKPITYEDTISSYNINLGDIASLKPWLLNNRQSALDTMQRTFDATEPGEFHYAPTLDIPGVQQAAAPIAAGVIDNYHQKLGKLFQRLSPAGEFLRDIQAGPTFQDRAYFNGFHKVLSLPIAQVLYWAADRTYHVRRRELISVYGHEGEGHALNHVITEKSDLPFIQKEPGYSVSATMESVAQFYQTLIFDDLKGAPDIQRELEIDHVFEGIYQRQIDLTEIEKYKNRLDRYSISVLADKSLGDPRDPKVIEQKIGLVEEVAIFPRYARSMIDNYAYSYDSAGNLKEDVTGELRYIVQPVERALKILEAKGKTPLNDRSTIDLTLLTGFWTPEGLVEIASLVK